MNKVDKILQEEILYNYIFDNTGLSLSYQKFQIIFDLIQTKNENWEFHLSGDWKIIFSIGELKIKNNSTA